MSYIRLSLVWASLLIISNAFASESIEEVIVTSSFIDQEFSQIENPIHIVLGDDLDGYGTQSLGESINDLLGVSSTDYGSGVGQPVIRGMMGNRVRVLKNGMVNRDVSGLGADHINDIDLHNVQQIEVIRGPSSLLYSNGTIGGIVNVVDNTIAKEDFAELKLQLGLEFQSVNDGDSQNIFYQDNVGGFNITAAYKDSSFDNFDIPRGAILHREEEHEEHEEEEHEEHAEHEEHEEHENADFLSNSDFESTSKRFGISKTGDWGYFGISYVNIESIYGIPFHGEEHGEAHGGHEEHDEDEMHGDEHEGERIFSTTDSDKIDIQGSLNFNNNWLKKIDYHFRDSDYSLTEQHAENGAHHDEDEHDEDEHHDKDEHGDEHHAEGPTLFENESKEYGATFDLSRETFSQKLVINYLEEDMSIIGSEAYMNPASSEEIMLGYYFSREFDLFHVDFGFRHDRISKKGSMAHSEEHEEHDEDEHDEDHDGDDHHDEDHDGDDHHDGEHAEVEYFDQDINNTSFALSIGREINDMLDVSLGIARVERAPSVVELYMNGPHLATGRFETGNPNLESEVSKNIDLSFNYEHDGFYGVLNFFRNDVDDYIYLLDETEEEHEEHEEHEGDHGGLILAEYLQRDAEFRGYELEVGKTVDFARGNLTFSFGRDDISGEFSDGSNIPRVVAARNIYSISYSENENFEVKLKLKDVDKQDDVGVNETPTNDYQMLDFKLTKIFTFDSKINLKVSIFGNNLLDEVARNHTSFVKDQVPLPGRNYGIKFNVGI